MPEDKEYKKAVDLLLQAYEPNATLNDINLILSFTMSKSRS